MKLHYYPETDSLYIIQRDNAEKPGSRRARFFNPAPETNAAVDLDLAAKRGCDDFQTPFTPNVRTFSQHLFLKIACRFQPPAPLDPCVGYLTLTWVRH